jgi:membrane protease YdiL (CAAX protease family)
MRDHKNRHDETSLEARQPAPASPARLALIFAILFIAYQLPEGLGLRILHSVPILSALMLAFLPIAWLAGRALGFRGLDAWFMGISPRWSLLLAACFALAVLANAGALGVGVAIGVYQIAPLGQTIGWPMLLAALWTMFQTFFPSVAEDIVTRGFLMRALPGLSRRWLFVLISAGVYVLNHIYRLANGPSEWLMLFCFGLAYGAALFYSRTLWAAIGLHWGWNFAGGFSDQIVSVDRLVPSMHPMMLAAAHLLMLGVVMVGMHALSKWRMRQELTKAGHVVSL